MTRRDLEQRLANTTWSRPPANVPMGTCWCGGAYMDTEIGADSHEVVFSHRPAKRKAPRPEGEAPTQSTETALHSGDENAASARDPTTDPGQNTDTDDSTNEQE